MAMHTNHFRALDGLRGVASILIVLFHVPWTTHVTQNNCIRNCYLFVDFFFILSGFVLATHYLNKKINPVRSTRDFLLARFFRIYPLHITMLLMFVSLELFKLYAEHYGKIATIHHPFTGIFSVKSLIANILMVQGIGIINTNTWNSTSWYVSCMFAIYAVFALGVFSVLLKNIRLLVIATTFASFGYIGLFSLFQTLDISGNGTGLARGICGFFLGMVLRRFSSKYADTFITVQSSHYLSFLQLAAVVGTGFILYVASGWLIILAVPMFLFIIFVFQSDRGIVAEILGSRVMQRLGSISYSIYMTHYFFLVVTSIVLQKQKYIGVNFVYDSTINNSVFYVNLWTGDVILMIYVLFVVLASTAAYHLIENPIRSYASGRLRPFHP